MRFRRHRPFFKFTICIERSEDVFVEAMIPPQNWPGRSVWFEQLKKATPEQRVPMLIGALIANEALRIETQTIQKSSGPSTSFLKSIFVPGLDPEKNRR